MEDLFAERAVDIQRLMARLRRVAEQEGLPLAERKKTFNSRLAQELGKWAEAEGKGTDFHLSVFRAYFAEGRNIGLREELIKLAKELGFSADKAERVLKERTYREAVDQDWLLSRDLGVTAVPTLVLRNHHFVGAQPYEAFVRFLEENRVPRRCFR